MNKILYISLTGMTEPLGRSQVLEYLIELSSSYEIHLLSFERRKDTINFNEIEMLTNKYNIKWQNRFYSNKFGLLSSVYQLIIAYFIGSKIIKNNAVEIIHARSMIPATIGWLLKIRHRVKLLFDIRGFAIDEKIDSGRLKYNSLLYKILKRIENKLYKVSDHIVTLTIKSKEILSRKYGILKNSVTVIPTCANGSIFRVMNDKKKSEFKLSLGYTLDDKVIIHTGTVTGWYDFESELILVKEMMNQDSSIKFLVLNKNDHSFIDEKFKVFKLPSQRIKILSCSFESVYKYLNISYFSIFFIKPTFSKQASAPTKFAENVSCQLYSITNGNVGDMDFYINKYNVGFIVDLLLLRNSIVEIANDILNNLENMETSDDDFEELYKNYFDKNIAVTNYNKIYSDLLNIK